MRFAVSHDDDNFELNVQARRDTILSNGGKITAESPQGLNGEHVIWADVSGCDQKQLTLLKTFSEPKGG